MLKLTGTIVEIQPATIEKAPDGREYAKQTFAIEYGDEYPRETAFEVDPDRFRGLDTAKIGDTVEVSFSATSRKSKTGTSAGKYFTSLRAIRMQNLSTAVQPQYAQPVQQQQYAPPVQQPQPQQPAPNYWPPRTTTAANPQPQAAPAQPVQGSVQQAESDDIPF